MDTQRKTSVKKSKKVTNVNSCSKAWFLLLRHKSSLQVVELIAFGATAVDAFKVVRDTYRECPLEMMDAMLITNPRTIINASYMTCKPQVTAV